MNAQKKLYLEDLDSMPFPAPEKVLREIDENEYERKYGKKRPVEKVRKTKAFKVVFTFTTSIPLNNETEEEIYDLWGDLANEIKRHGFKLLKDEAIFDKIEGTH